MNIKQQVYICLSCLVLMACGRPQVPESYSDVKQLPNVYPDYCGVTVPVNIAPLHFQLMDVSDEVVTRFTAGSEVVVCGGRQVCPSEDDWRALADAACDSSIGVEVFAQMQGQWKRYQPFQIHVSKDKIDPWLSYRLISPSYVAFEELTLNQRCLESFDERIIYNNMLCTSEAEGQCVNCHSYQKGNPQRMQFHARLAHGGTLINFDGHISKVNLKTDSTLSAGVYPAWHPTKNLIAYSTNKTMQMFHTRDVNKVEVLDSESGLILYDLDRGEVSTVENDPEEMEVFPFWSPDGKYLYYCSARFERKDTVEVATEAILRYQDIKYNVYRRPFQESTLTFGPRELVFDAAAQGLSATLPRISPDGRWLLLSVGHWGVFHIWHRDADLWVMDLNTMEARPLNGANSPEVEGYHTWSSDGRWIVFSSRRYDGNFTRPFFAHFDGKGNTTKPFELPCEDPDNNRQLLKSYNIPELMLGPVTVTPQEFADALKQEAQQAKYVSR